MIKNKVVIVLGMHRSGTSALAGILKRLGVEFGEKLLPGDLGVNDKGFYEHIGIINIHEQIFKTIGYTWFDIRPMPEQWWMFDEIVIFKEALKDIIRNDFSGSTLWGIKDPRMCRLLPLWLQILTELDLEPLFVLCLRHPAEVAESLHNRDGFEPEGAHCLWLRYVLESEQYSRPYLRTVVCHSAFIVDWRQEVLGLSRHFNIKWPNEKENTYLQIDDFIEPELHHCKAHDPLPATSFANLSYRLFYLLKEGNFKACDKIRELLVEEINNHESTLEHINKVQSFHLANSDIKRSLEYKKRNYKEQLWPLDSHISKFKITIINFLNQLAAQIRRFIINISFYKSLLRIYAERSVFIIRQEGFIGLVRKYVYFVKRYWKRRSASKKLERFKINADKAISDLDEPLVSFVIPIYDRTDFLRVAINSALEQSVQVFEVILVTDGSPPATLAVVEEYASDPRVRIFNYPVNSGNAVRGRNKGILEARGRYIAFLDSDDIATPDRLEMCLPVLESKIADVVYGGWRAILDGSRVVDGLVHNQEVYSEDCDLSMLKQTCVPCQSTVMMRREMLLQHGFLKPRMQYREDHELWLRLAYHGAKFKSVPHLLTELRLHSGNNELNFKDNDSHWESLLAEEYRLSGPIPRKIGFLLVGLNISGGLAVILKHVSMLMELGHDAFVIDLGGCGDIAWFGNLAIPVYRMDQVNQYALGNIDLLFATHWTTVSWLEKIPAQRKLYFVQSDERLFYDDNSIKVQVADTYRKNYEYVVIAQWLADMLHDEFGKSATYVPNGLDRSLFYSGDPLEVKSSQRLRVLIEGPISEPIKGVTEAYTAVSELDCELWIVSYDGKPEKSWRYNRFFTNVKLAEMRGIYSSCDILLKMSHVESFAYPPLEAMACGCAVVLAEVNGGIEYACDGQNVLIVPEGDVVAARAAVEKLHTNLELRESLIQAGFETVKHWSWDASRESMISLVEEDINTSN